MNNDYDINDVLLNVYCPTSGTVTIKLNLLRKVDVEFQTITPILVSLSQSDFVVLS